MEDAWGRVVVLKVASREQVTAILAGAGVVELEAVHADWVGGRPG